MGKIGRQSEDAPVLILTRGWIIQRLTHVTVAPISRSIRDIPTHVKLSPADGLVSECSVNLDNIQTVPKEVLFQRVALLRHERMEEIFAAIRAAFEMPR